MAGDWIKMRADLFTHPKVVRMASALKADTFRTVGGLMSAWCLFDAHSDDGRLDGYSLAALDAHLRWEGFAAAMVAVGWLESDQSDSLVLPRFDTHNGRSAKRRATDAERKRDVRKVSASNADKKRTREEKRREEREEDISLVTPLPRDDPDERDRAYARIPENHENQNPSNPFVQKCPQTAQNGPRMQKHGVVDTEVATGHENGPEARKTKPDCPPSPSPAAQASIAMRKAGLANVNPGHPTLQAMVEAGVDVDAFADAAADAVGRGKGFAYAMSILTSRVKEAAEIAKLGRVGLEKKTAIDPRLQGAI